MTVSLSTVDAILRLEDMEGLIALGAPEDEYSDEAAEIHIALAQFGDRPTREQISVLVMDVWKLSFGPFSAADIQKRQSALQQLVHRILDERFPGNPSGESSEANSGFAAGAGGK